MIPNNPELDQKAPPVSVHVAGLRCPKCHRVECDLTATVIIGEINWFKAVAECIDWQTRIAALPKGKALAVMGHDQYRTLKESGLA